MKLVTYEVDSKKKLGVVSRDGEWVFPLTPIGVEYKTMEDLIEQVSDSELQLIDYTSVQDPYSVKNAAKFTEVKLLSPIPEPDRDIICLGKNYLEHAKESASFKKEEFDPDKAVHDKAIYFPKRMNYTSADGDMIPAHADLTSQLDYECELAVIIRKDADHVDPDKVRDYIFGYTIINDVSARDLQIEHKQWLFAKSLDGFAPLGPCILTADSIIYPPALDIKSYVNGELRQNSNTNMFIHNIDEVISELSKGMVLRAGTIIATGTPAGVGMGFVPPRYLKPGDTVVCEIEGIGKLTNSVE